MTFYACLFCSNTTKVRLPYKTMYCFSTVWLVPYRARTSQSYLWLGFNHIRKLVLPASRFQDILDRRSRTSSIYGNCTLAQLSSSARGKIIEQSVRRILMDADDKAVFEDPCLGFRVDGSRRGKGQSAYDWLQDGRRIECKSSQLQWNGRRWHFNFCNIKFDDSTFKSGQPFDDLILVLFSPERLHMYCHDGMLGRSRQCIRTMTNGHVIQIGGPLREESWRIALERILDKLDSASNACKYLADVSLCNRHILSAYSEHSRLAQNVYQNIPLATMSPPQLGLCIEAIVRRVNELLAADGCVHECISDVCVNGSARAWHQATCDWIRDGQRIECKSSKLQWCSHHKRWMFYFRAIKLYAPGPCFDELQLALYTPRGIYVYKHDLHFGLSSTGLDSVNGLKISVSGPRSEENYAISLDSILLKFDKSGCKRIAFIPWK
eukprot:TRINITY_DN7170_c1_g1_i1.p1 TRINITY_DN7170_c1_g1~~TRINITY_DN7170_c1_g1_i1.p1  ORF type:complete len:436 (+),score=7.25 TRINITY_DN7170_c1_g1_i1:234-1541(+)